MSNLIQIKRSSTNAAPAAGGLRTGELAYSFLSTSNSLFVGDTSNNAVRVGGGKYPWLHQSNTSAPGTLTANAVVIVNGNSFVTDWKTNSITIGVDGETVSITNVSTFANSTQLGDSAGGANTELVSSWAIKTYIDNNAARLPNTYVAFGANNVANGGSAAFTFDSDTTTLSLGNSSVNTQISQTSITSANFVANSSGVYTPKMFDYADNNYFVDPAGNTNIANLQVNLVSTGNISLGASSGDTVSVNGGVNTNINPKSSNTYALGNATAKWASLDVGGTATINNADIVTINVSSTAQLGNTTITGYANVSSDLNVTGNANVGGEVQSGNTTVTGYMNVSYTGAFGGELTVGSNISLYDILIHVGNTTVNTRIQPASIDLNGTTGSLIIGNTATNTTITESAITVSGSVTATGLANVATLNVVGNTDIGGVTTISNTANVTGNVAIGGITTISNTLVTTGLANLATANVVGNTDVGGNLTVSGDGTINGNVTLGSDTSDVITVNAMIGSNLIPSVTLTDSIGNTTYYWNTAYVGTGNFNSANINGALSVGNTTVTGYANVSTTLQVDGAATFGNTLTTSGLANLASANIVGGLAVGGNTSIAGKLDTGNTTITGSANVTTTLEVGGVSTLGANVNITGTANATAGRFGDLDVTGNLSVSGTLTTINANNITVTDSLIQLASNNSASDLLDIGFFGLYQGDANNFTGLFRDSSDNGVYKLFEGLAPAPTTTIDTANDTFSIATLQAFVKTGGHDANGFIANSTTIAITANADLNVAISANTLTLSTALAGNSGGTGLNSFSAEDILVANSSNGFKRLAVGSEGYVLQVTSGAVSYNTLDGGSF